MARKKLNRAPLEDIVRNYIRNSRQCLETFTDLDYYEVGADKIWVEAEKKIKAMPNYKLQAIVTNIYADLKGEISFESYYEVFNI